jgi:uncharacterized protein (TIGR02145 family)
VKKLLILIGIFCALKTNAQDYLINFIGTNAPINIVQVENLSTGEILSLRGSDVLHLNNVITGISRIDKTIVGMKIYPNPTINNSTTIKFNVPSPGDATISIFNLKGEKIIQRHDYLSNSLQEYKLHNINKGLYLVDVRNINYHLTGKIVCSGVSNGTMNIEKLSNNQTVEYKNTSMEKQTSVTRSLEVDGIVDMLYMPGNMLKFTAISGEYRTTSTDVPDKTKTITFNIIPVVDQDSNNYHIVEIGDQAWLEENMKTTKYRDGLSIPIVTDNTKWSTLTSGAYSWYDNSKTSFKDPYGALYNGFAIGTGRICPIGWHIPTMDEWNALRDYLNFNNYDYSNEILRSNAKSLASKTLWNVPQPIPIREGYSYPSPAAVGLNPQINNSSGFNGFAAGIRKIDGSYADIGKSTTWATNWGSDYIMAYNLQYQLTELGRNWEDRHSGFSVRCIKGEVKTLPVLVTTNNVYNITQTTATVETSIPGEGESPITSKGVCWSEYSSTRTDFPTIDDFKTVDGSGTAPFISNITGLKPGTLYYIRGYSINSEGVSYGNWQTVTTDVADADGNNYNTILLYDMIWTVQNLKTTKLNDNTPISIITDNARWAALKNTAPPHIPGLCWYNNDIQLKDIYGGLYNWFAVSTDKLCPIGWHVSSDDDWTSLTAFLAGDRAGGRLKEPGTVHWLSPNTGAGQDDNSGFKALPGGKRDATGIFIDIGSDGFWWTSTEQWIDVAWHRGMAYDLTNVSKAYSDKSDGMSVRCVKKAN